ncbi:ethylene-responsive transcription factor CRF4 [Corchorus olitorius]|uniref:Ethylene-responsive transcription factor CRF4 n=1 Tax=Corchorus olitorius TaxID=93759 RepID=A0A1R3GE80_9ROSI|nr:ethylene-responsive transcription factor CRF4 [Corchorus olitorius]
MEQSILCPIKYTEHKNVTKIFRKPSSKPKKFCPDNISDIPRIVRVSVTDPDATDSSSDEEADFFGRQRVKRYVNEINVETTADAASAISNNSRKRTAAAADVTTPYRRPLKLSSSNAIKLRGPDALTNFVNPPAKENNEKPDNINVASVSGYESGDESSHNLSSPTSVLNFRTQSSEETAVEPEKPVQELQEEESKPPPVQEKMVLKECQGETETNLPDDLGDYNLSLDFPFLDEFFNIPVLGLSLFDDTATILPDSSVFSDDLSEMLLDTPQDFGCSSSSSISQVDDYFEDIGDLFFSDPLVAL